VLAGATREPTPNDEYVGNALLLGPRYASFTQEFTCCPKTDLFPIKKMLSWWYHKALTEQGGNITKSAQFVG
jgi:hypothetical protein